MVKSVVADAQPGSEDGRNPLGREVGVVLATRIWLGVLVVGTVTVGFLQQRVDPFQAFNAIRYFIVLTIVIVAALTVWVVLRFVFRIRMLQAVAGTGVFVLLFFRWPAFVRIALEVGTTGLVRDLLVVGIPALAAFVFLSRSRRSVVLVGATVAVVLGLLGATAPYAVWAVTDRRPFDFVEVDIDEGRRDDVVVIVLDTYLREDLLLETMGFDNSDFARDLEDRGFVVDDDAMSNYNRSFGSVASMMALDPVLTEGDMSTEDLELVRFLLGGGGPFFGSYRDAGYEVTSYLTGWRGTRCTEFIDYCIRRGVVASTAWYLGEITPFAPILHSSIDRPLTSTAIPQLDRLSEDVIEAFERETPQFVWAHIELPHPPFVLDASCGRQDDERLGGLVFASTKVVFQFRADAYAEQIQCVNRMALEQIDEILAANPDSQILVVSDHGAVSPRPGSIPGSWTRTQRAEMFSVIAAVRGPQACDDVVEALTLVNTFRRFVACTLDAEIGPGSSQQYVTPSLKRPGQVFQVESPQP